MDNAALALTGVLRDELAQNASDTTALPVRFSTLKSMGKSAAHCRYSMLNDWEPTLSMRIGQGAHSLLLGGPPVVECKARRGTKDWKAVEDANPGAIILNRSEHAKAVAINAAVRGNALAQRVLYQPGTIYEETIHFEYLGRKCRATPDARTHRHLVDLKTTRCAEPDKFQWDATRMAYHGQLALYREAMFQANGFYPASCYIVAVETAPPYAVSVHELTPGALSIGLRLCKTWMEKLIACEQSGSWPGYCESVVPWEVADLELNLTFADDDESGDDNNATDE